MANSKEQMCSTISTKVWNDKVKECDNWKEKYLSTYATNCEWANTLQNLTGLNKKLQEEIKGLSQKVESLEGDLKEAEDPKKLSEKCIAFFCEQQLKLKKVEEDLKNARLTTTRMAYEKYWMLGEDGVVEPEIDQVKQDFKDGNLSEAELKYLLEYWGHEDELEDEDPHN